MGKQLTPVGRAVATAKGHYPDVNGRHVTRQPGDTFTVFVGLDKAKWFTVLPPDAPAPAKPEPAPPATEPETLAAAAGVERKRRAGVKPPLAVDPPAADDIA